jgi:hypothetical protein
MIRPATSSDTERCLILAKQFYGDFLFENGIEMVDDDLRRTVEYFIASGQNLVVEHDGLISGMVAWIISPHPANAQCKILQEVLWCCNSKILIDALLLLRGFERKAAESNADVVMLANLSLNNEPTLRRIYGRMGYVYTESHYSKRRIS